MPFDVSLTITGLQEAQAQNLATIEALKPRGGLGRAVRAGTAVLYRGVIANVHVDTGSLRASQRIEYTEGPGWAQGRIYTDPTATNPRTGRRPVVYGVYEHDRGGQHAYADLALLEFGPAAVAAAVNELLRSIP